MSMILSNVFDQIVTLKLNFSYNLFPEVILSSKIVLSQTFNFIIF